MSESNLRERLRKFLHGTWRGAKRLQGLQGGARAYILSLVAEEIRRPILMISSGARDAEDLFEDLTFFVGEERAAAPLRKRLHLFPSWEVLR